METKSFEIPRHRVTIITSFVLGWSTYAHRCGNGTTGSFPPPRLLRRVRCRSFHTVVGTAGVQVAELRVSGRPFDAIMRQPGD
jgi:hypothetical protein